MKYLLYFLISMSFSACVNNNPDVTFNVIKTHDFLRDIPVYTDDSLVNIVVEIPAGCNQKWEVNKQTGFLEWERISNDSLRTIKYLPYPANYGMIPRTWLPESEGGDNDPLDVFLLGKSVERGSIVPSRIIGIVRMLDDGDQDDKLIAVPVDQWFANIFTIEQLNKEYPGITAILSTWLLNYKGAKGQVELLEIMDDVYAKRILNKASEAYRLSFHIEK